MRYMKLKSLVLAAITATIIGVLAPGASNARDLDKKGHSQKDSVSADDSAPPSPINKASHFIGMTVKNQNGDRLGKIKDVVIDFDSGQVAYVVLAKAGAKGGTGKYL